MKQDIQITQILEMNEMEEQLTEQGAQPPIMSILVAQKKEPAYWKNKAFETVRKHVFCKWYVNWWCMFEA